MCDTLVALGNSTEDGNVIFGKNSNRPNDEAQLITYNPRTKYSKGINVRCTYISIPQVAETAAVLLSQPYWMWGAEMGANEYGVVIGNEAVHTLEPLRYTGLLGMDLLRLGLERGKTAIEALTVITELIEKNGQGGGCAYGDSSWLYHNSFIIADPEEAYVLETADMWWIVEKVKSVRSISNGVTIRGKGDIRRKGIIEHAVEKGYCRDDRDFDFASTFTGYQVSNTPSPYSREGKSTILLKQNMKKITPKMMMEFLREHEAGICMHGGFESTGSQVSLLTNEKMCTMHWFTASTLPCLSIYKPYVFPIGKQKVLKPGPYTSINPEWFWSKHTKFIRNYQGNVKKQKYMSELRSIESDILDESIKVVSEDCTKNEANISNKISSLNLEAWKKSNEIIN